MQGVLGSCLNNSVHTWTLRLKGPLFVSMFKPLSIAIAVAMGVMFLGDDLYLGRYYYLLVDQLNQYHTYLLFLLCYKERMCVNLHDSICSVIGAAIISIGFYTVMWGKAKEDVIKDEAINSESSSTPRSPLLQYYKDEDVESK